MNEEEIKDVVDFAIEWLHTNRHISETTYGNMPATVGEEIAEAFMKQREE
jgi:hypothetical protein